MKGHQVKLASGQFRTKEQVFIFFFFFKKELWCFLLCSAVDAEGLCGLKRRQASGRRICTQLPIALGIPVVQISKLQSVTGGHYLGVLLCACSLF